MKALYTLCPDPDSTQRLVDAFRVASLDLGFDANQIVVVSGEPYEGYDFSDEHAKSPMLRSGRRSAAFGGLCGYLITSLTQKPIRCRPAACPSPLLDQRHHRLRDDHARRHPHHPGPCSSAPTCQISERSSPIPKS